MVKNKKLLETLFTCVKSNGSCKGCFYGDGFNQPQCMLHLMNDMLFFFKNPVPSKEAHVMSYEELEDSLSDHKDHLCFAEYINSIHVAQPFICTITLKQNVFTLYDPESQDSHQFLKDEYYTKFRVWSTKPIDSIRQSTEWIPIDGYQYSTDNPSQKVTKTQSILDFIKKMT